MMENGWMVFLWAGAGAGILLVWLVIVATVVVHIEERHEQRNRPAGPTSPDDRRSTTDAHADDESRHALVS